MAVSEKSREEYFGNTVDRNNFLLKVKKIENDKDTVWSVFFEDKYIAKMVGNSKGVSGIPIAVNLKGLAGWSFEPTDQTKIDPNAPFIDINQVSKKDDDSGVTYAVIFGGSTEIFNLNATFKGFAKGGDHHDRDIVVITLEGEAEWSVGIDENLKGKEVRIQRGGDILRIPANEPHFMVANKNTLITEVPIYKNPFNATKDKNRDIVEKLNEETRRLNMLAFSKRI